MSCPLSPREKRVIKALLDKPVMREDLDGIAGSSNSPDIIYRLRLKGFEAPCYRIEGRDRDGRRCLPGRYEFTTEDKARGREILEVGAARPVQQYQGGR